MNNDIKDKLKQIASVDFSSLKKLDRFFESLDLQEKAEILFNQSQIKEKLKRDNSDLSENELLIISFYKSLNNINSLFLLKKRKKNISKYEHQKIDQFKVSQVRRTKAGRQSKVKEIIKIKYFDLIFKLRETEKLSWQSISEYLEKFEATKINRQALQRNFEKIKKELAGIEDTLKNLNSEK